MVMTQNEESAKIMSQMDRDECVNTAPTRAHNLPPEKSHSQTER